MRTKACMAFAVAALALVLAGVAQAITFGQLDGDRHPNVGALVAEFDGEKALICSGTLIDEDVFLTASHCTVGLDRVWVTFDPSFDEDSPLLPGTAHTNPLFGVAPGFADTHDIAVVTLDEPVSGIAPASLPRRNQLNGMALKKQRFTAVGYGTVREDKTAGPHSLFFDGQRRFADQGFNALGKTWLHLSMNPSTGSGGTCYGDSGGPHFIGSGSVVASITVTGDAWCRATDVTYRTDTASARAFLGDFVTLP